MENGWKIRVAEVEHDAGKRGRAGGCGARGKTTAEMRTPGGDSAGRWPLRSESPLTEGYCLNVQDSGNDSIGALVVVLSAKKATCGLTK